MRVERFIWSLSLLVAFSAQTGSAHAAGQCAKIDRAIAQARACARKNRASAKKLEGGNTVNSKGSGNGPTMHSTYLKAARLCEQAIARYQRKKAQCGAGGLSGGPGGSTGSANGLADQGQNLQNLGQAMFDNANRAGQRALQSLRNTANGIGGPNYKGSGAEGDAEDVLDMDNESTDDAGGGGGGGGGMGCSINKYLAAGDVDGLERYLEWQDDRLYNYMTTIMTIRKYVPMSSIVANCVEGGQLNPFMASQGESREWCYTYNPRSKCLSPLMVLAQGFASDEDSVEMAKMLAAAGAGFGVRNRDGWTALHYAVSRGKYKLAKYLLENDEDPCRRGVNGTSPRNLAYAQGGAMWELVKSYPCVNNWTTNCKNDLIICNRE